MCSCACLCMHPPYTPRADLPCVPMQSVTCSPLQPLTVSLSKAAILSCDALCCVLSDGHHGMSRSHVQRDASTAARGYQPTGHLHMPQHVAACHSTSQHARALNFLACTAHDLQQLIRIQGPGGCMSLIKDAAACDNTCTGLRACWRAAWPADFPCSATQTVLAGACVCVCRGIRAGMCGGCREAHGPCSDPDCTPLSPPCHSLATPFYIQASCVAALATQMVAILPSHRCTAALTRAA